MAAKTDLKTTPALTSEIAAAQAHKSAPQALSSESSIAPVQEDAETSCIESVLQYLSSFVQWVQELYAGIFGSSEAHVIDLGPSFELFSRIDTSQFLSPSRIFMGIYSPILNLPTAVSTYQDNALFSWACATMVDVLHKHVESMHLPLTSTDTVVMGLYVFSKGSKPDTFTVQIIKCNPYPEPQFSNIDERRDVPLQQLPAYIYVQEALHPAVQPEEVFKDGEIVIEEGERQAIEMAKAGGL